MLVAFDRFCLIVSLTKPSTVEFSTTIRLRGCGWPSSARVVRIGTDSWPLMKVAPISASAAKDMKLLMILDTV